MLSQDEVKAILAELNDRYRMMIELIYGGFPSRKLHRA